MSNKKEVTIEEIFKSNRPVLGGEMSIVPWRLLRLFGLKKIFPEVSDEILYGAGKEVGKVFNASSVEEFCRSLSDMKIGIVEVVSKSESKIIISIKECASCYGLELIGDYLCYFESGLIAGGVEKILGKLVTSKETKCIAGFGDDVCQFELTF